MRRWWLVRAHHRGDEWPITSVYMDRGPDVAARRAREKVDEVRRQSPTARVGLIEMGRGHERQVET